MNADAIVEAELIAASTAATDSAFIDPANGGIVGAQPASILFGAPSIPATNDPRTDLRALFDVFAGDLSTSYFVMHPNVATSLALFTAGGNFIFPDIGPRGGTLIGLPVLTSKSVPIDSSGSIVALVDAAALIVADDGVQLDLSKHADLAMTDAVGSGPHQLVSLWTTNSVALRVIRRINWQIASGGRAIYLSGVAW